MSEFHTFIYVLNLIQPELFDDMPPEKEEIINEHFEYLKKGFQKGNVILAGPCLDGEFGIVIFRAPTQKEAEDFMNNDPAVKKGIMTAELHPFRISLMGKM